MTRKPCDSEGFSLSAKRSLLWWNEHWLLAKMAKAAPSWMQGIDENFSTQISQGF